MEDSKLILENIKELFETKIDSVREILEEKIDRGFEKTNSKQDYTNGNVKELLNWKSSREPMLVEICEERMDVKLRKREFFWKTINKGFELFWKVAAIIVAMAISGINIDKIISYL
jgi:hypothetical protein